MKKYLPVLVISGVLLVTFQNCSRQSINSGAGTDSSASLPQSKIADPTLAQAESLDILTQSDDVVNLNLTSGEMIQNVQGVLVKKCLSEDELGKLQDLLSNSQLCQFDPPGPDVLCAQVYSSPYSEIHWTDKSVKVGEAYSSCQKNIDLCGNDGLLLRSLLKDILTRWNEWSCDFKVVSSQ